MMLIARLFPRYDVDKIWEYIEERFPKIKRTDIVPLFMSQHDYQNFVSVIIEANDPDSLADFLAAEIAPCKEIASSRTITLIKPAFFYVPKGLPEDICRFRVAVKIDPSYYTQVYDKVLNLSLPSKLHYAYITYSFGEDDMLISIIAENRQTVRQFVTDSIEKIEGVDSASLLLTHRTKRLTDDNTWRNHERKYASSRFLPGTKSAGEDDFDWTYLDHCCIHGALPDEG